MRHPLEHRFSAIVLAIGAFAFAMNPDHGVRPWQTALIATCLGIGSGIHWELATQQKRLRHLTSVLSLLRPHGACNSEAWDEDARREQKQ